MLLNLSNHPSIQWPKNQESLAIEKYSIVEDLPFPQIDPKLSGDDLDQQVEEYETIIRKIDPDAVHIMGEMTFTFRLVSRLKDIGIPCVASTTEREVRIDAHGKKISSFIFVRFRDY